MIQHQYKNQKFWITENKTVGVSFSCEILDLESDLSAIHLKIKEVLKNLNPKVRLRIEKSVSRTFYYPHNTKRSEAIKQLGHLASSVNLSLEFVEPFNPLEIIKVNIRKKDSNLDLKCEVLLSAMKQLEQCGFVFKPTVVKDQPLKDIFISERSLESENGSLGILRLFKLPTYEFETIEFQELLNKLPKPHTIHTSLERMDEVKAKLLFEKRLKQTSSDKSVEAEAQSELTESLLQKTYKSGAKFFEYELVIEFKRNSKEELTQTLLEAKSALQGLDTIIETFGLYPSYLATRPGVSQHVPMIESDEVTASILPVYGRSESLPSNFAYNRSLPLLRSDGSLSHFDLFNGSYNVFNALMIGTSGKGKSVLLGLLTQSLLNDPNVCIIKLDVGGSHSKECELFGGTEYQMTLDQGSGINPFEVLNIREASLPDKIAILSKFLASLIQEQGEIFLSKTLRSEIEEAVSRYIESEPVSPSLQDLFEFSSLFPRRELLKRWCKGGVYEGAFAIDGYAKSWHAILLPTAQQLRLRYYNFSKIFQASDPEFAIAGVSAVLAQYNMELLKENGKRVVLICDEMPFFIKHCFDFFKFSTTNLRKLGNAVVLTGQVSSSFVVDGDTTIIDNSRQRFLFSVDGKEQEYVDRLQLTSGDLETIKDLRTVTGQYSQCLFKSEDQAMRLQIEVTRSEYWELTTSKVDKEKLVDLMRAVRGLSLQEAINCLSVER